MSDLGIPNQPTPPATCKTCGDHGCDVCDWGASLGDMATEAPAAPQRQTWTVTGVRCRNGADYPEGPEAYSDGTFAYLSLPTGSGGERSSSDIWLADPVVTLTAALGDPTTPSQDEGADT